MFVENVKLTLGDVAPVYRLSINSNLRSETTLVKPWDGACDLRRRRAVSRTAAVRRDQSGGAVIRGGDAQPVQ
jgi:hypothetical protein